jgi:hypothetical protein
VLIGATGHADHRRAADLGEPLLDEPPYTYACEIQYAFVKE